MTPFHHPALRAEGGEPLIDDVDRARAQEYALLATLLSRGPDARLLSDLARLMGDASPLGAAHAALAHAAANASADSATAEYFELFEGLGRGQVLPYASYYLAGSLNGLPLARLRDTLRSLGMERTQGHAEPEDHAAILCEIMARLIGDNMAPAGADRAIFDEHLAPWMGRFFGDLESNVSAGFYARVGTVGRIFMEIEAAAFALLP